MMAEPDDIEGYAVDTPTLQMRLTSFGQRFWTRVSTPHVQVHFAGCEVLTFQGFIVSGTLLGMLASILIGSWIGLELGVVLGCVTFAALGSLGFVILRRFLTGRANLTYYHYAFASTISPLIFLTVINYPLLTYLDVTLIGLGLAQAVGRIGCLMAGCCHGRPARRGIRYGAEHVRNGWPGYLRDVALIPVQFIESLWSITIVIAAAFALFRDSSPGTAVVIYVTGYSLGRYGCEFLRGDRDRRYWYGATEAQWISVVLSAAVALFGGVGLLPLLHWQVAIAALMSLAISEQILLARYRSRSAAAIIDPEFVHEIARALAHCERWENHPQPVRMSHGIWLSSETVETGNSPTEIHALSCEQGQLNDLTVSILTRLILALRPPQADHHIVEGRQGVTFLVIGTRIPHVSNLKGLG